MQGSVEDVLRSWKLAQTKRQNHDVQRQAISRYLFPDGGDFTSITTTQGHQRDQEILDATPVRALFRSGAILEALFAPRHTKWQGLRSPHEEINQRHEVQEYTEQVRRVLFTGRQNPRADFYGEKARGYLSTSAYGEECFLVEEMLDTQIRYESIPIQDVWVEYNAMKRPGVFFIQFTLTAWAAKDRWGDKSPRCVHEAIQNGKQWENLTFLQVIRPRPNADPDSTNALDLPLESLEISPKDISLITEGGFHEMPYMAPRATVVPGESYGRGFGHQALPDAKSLMTLEGIFQSAGSLAALPPLLAMEDGPFGYGQKTIRFKPRAVHFGGLDDQARPVIKPMETGGDVGISAEMVEQKRGAIKETFLTDFFQIFSDQSMTLGEVMVRLSERGNFVAPLAGSQNSEMFGPLTQRELGIHGRAGRLPEMPEALIEAGGGLELFYENQATRLIRQEELVSMSQGLDVLDRLREYDPTVSEIPNAHKMARLAFEINGQSATVLNSPDDVEEAVRAAAEQSDQREAAGALPGLASAGKDLVDSGLIDPAQLAGAAA